MLAHSLSARSQQEGVAALWTGLGPNIARNAIINAAELASYDQVKEVTIPPFLFHGTHCVVFLYPMLIMSCCLLS